MDKDRAHKAFLDVISSAIQNGENICKIYAQYFEVVDTTNDRQDIAGVSSNTFPPHLVKFIRKDDDITKHNDGRVTINEATIRYMRYYNGQEYVWDIKTGDILYGKEIPPIHAPTSHINWWELNVNPEDVKEVYYHGATMCLVIKLKNDEKIGIRSVSFSHSKNFHLGFCY